MKLITIQVPDDSVEFVAEFVERIGGSVAAKEEDAKEHKKAHGKKYKPLDFFGTWPDLDLDPKTYRKQIWRKVPGF